MYIASCELAQIASHKYLRSDTKYWKAVKERPLINYALLKDMFQIIAGTVQTSYYTTTKTDTPYIRIGDISYKFGISAENVIYLSDECDIGDEKRLRHNDMILTTIGTVGKVGIATCFAGGTFSNNVVCLRSNADGLDIYFYEKLFQSDYFLQYISSIVSQKAQPNLQQYDLENIRVPIVEQNTITQCTDKMRQIEEKINNIKIATHSTESIIDSVFAHEFGFDYSVFEELKTRSRFCTNLTAFASNPDLRFSAKFHREAGAYVMSRLQSVTSKQIKHYLAEPIVLGASIAPSDYSDEGEYYYISMASIKNWKFCEEDARFLSKKYAYEKQAVSVKQGDIIMARSGEGTIGKTALIDRENIQGIFSDFTMRIRLINYNPLFAYYYFRSSYFQYMIEIYKKGLGNNTNIFPVVLREFPLPDIPPHRQQQIVNTIQAEIAAQEAAKSQISALREEIDKIIEDAVRGCYVSHG